MSLYMDIFVCPNGHKRAVHRQTRSIGKTVKTYCTQCRKSYQAFSPGPKKDARLPQHSGGTKE